MSRNISIRIAFVFLCAAFLACAAYCAVQDSPVFDELAKFPAGFVALMFGDCRLNMEHPPFPQLLGSFAVYIFEQFPHPSLVELENQNGFIFGERMYFDHQSMLYALARSGSILQSLLIAVLGFWYLRKQKSALVALLAVFFFLSSPTILAHGHYATNDISCALGVLVFCVSYGQLCECPRFRNFVLFGGSVAFALLMKMTLLFVLPMSVILLYPVVFQLVERGRRVFVLAAVYCTILVVIDAAYAYAARSVSPDELQQTVASIALSGGRPGIVLPLQALVQFPLTRGIALFGAGFLKITGGSLGFALNYSFGQLIERSNGFLHYPLVLAVKETPIFLCLFLASLFFYALRLDAAVVSESKNWHSAKKAAFLFSFIFCIVVSFQPLQMVVRYFLPLYPIICAFLGCGTTAIFEKIKNRWGAKMAAAWLGLSIFGIIGSLASTFPYYTSYFNFSCGGYLNGDRCLVDSNHDWGQDVFRLAELKPEMKSEPIKAHFFVPYQLSSLKNQLDVQLLPWDMNWESLAKGEYVAISSTVFRYFTSVQSERELNAVIGEVPFDVQQQTREQLLSMEPVARIGSTIRVYRK